MSFLSRFRIPTKILIVIGLLSAVTVGITASITSPVALSMGNSRFSPEAYDDSRAWRRSGTRAQGSRGALGLRVTGYIEFRLIGSYNWIRILLPLRRRIEKADSAGRSQALSRVDRLGPAGRPEDQVWSCKSEGLPIL